MILSTQNPKEQQIKLIKLDRFVKTEYTITKQRIRKAGFFLS